MISPGVFLNGANNMDIYKAETNFIIDPYKNDTKYTRDRLWLFNGDKFGRSFADIKDERTSKVEKKVQQIKYKDTKRSIGKKHKKKKHKFKKCIYKLFKKGKRKKHKLFKKKKLLISLFLGILLAKSLFIPIVLKTLALIAAKGLIIGFFSNVIASVVNLRGMFNHYGHRNRKDDRTRAEIIHIPGKKDNVYEKPYRRNLLAIPLNKKM